MTGRTTATALTTVILLFSPWLETGWAQQMVFPGAEWETATPESQMVDSNLLQAAVDFLDASLPAGGGVNELVIIRNGRMIWEGPESDNVHIVYSMTKSFATTAVGLLVDDGIVSIDTLASDYVPSMAAECPNVTLRHLATHTSGYRPVEEPYPLPLYYDWMPDAPLDPGPPLFAPGSRHLYSVNGMDQMMNVLTRAAGEPMQDFFQRRIGDPIGLDPSSWDWSDCQDSDGIVAEDGSGGISISAKDAARLGHLFLNQGNWNGEQLISGAWVDAATSAQVPASLPEHPNSYSIPLGGVYGFGWWVNGVGANGARLYPGAPPETFAALGYNENNTFIIPEWNLVITREGTSLGITQGTWDGFFRRIGSAIIPTNGTTGLAPNSMYVVFDDDTDSVLDDRGDGYLNVLSRSYVDIGESDLQISNRVQRLVTKYRLPGRPNAAQSLKSVKLRFYLLRVGGEPAGPVSLFHSITDNDETALASDYEDTSYYDTDLDVVIATDPVGDFYELDVTSLVLDDYTADEGGAFSAFRLQVDGAFVEDNQSNFYRFRAPRVPDHPQLVLTFVPEPSAGILLLLGAVGSLCVANRRWDVHLGKRSSSGEST